jgi:16S rRNA G966 N2-methylase RsmD
VIVVEHERRQTAPDALGGLPLYRSRRHGDTVVSVYAQEDVG